MRSLRRFGVALAILVAPAVVPAAAGADWTAGACPTTSGVTVIVDFQYFGGDVVTRCAVGPQTDGLAALKAAGFPVTPTLQFGGFVCRIDAKPNPSAESSARTPTTASWSYWAAKRGGAWEYSDVGAGSPDTAPSGGVQGWSFSPLLSAEGERLDPPPPGANPPALNTAPPATSPPATVPSQQPAINAPSGGGTATGGAPASVPSGKPGVTAPAARSGATTPGAAPEAATTTTAPGASPDASVLGTSETAPPETVPGETTTTAVGATTTTEPITIELASGSSSSSDDGGSGAPWGTVVGLALIAALVGAAAVVHRRRAT